MGSLFETLFNFLVDLLTWVCTFFLNIVIEIINMTLRMLCQIYQTMISYLPDSCFLQLHIPPWFLDHIHYVNWFVPLDVVVNCITTFCCGLIGLLSVRFVLRFIRMAS